MYGAPVEIQLTEKLRGIARISQCDVERITQYKWHMNAEGYVDGSIKGKNIRLGRFIMEVTDPLLVVNHIEHEKLNNTRENLRVVTVAVNGANKSLQTKKQSGKYHGVFFNWGKHFAQVQRNGKRKYLGTFETEIRAAEEVDLYKFCVLEETINLNFPKKLEEYKTKKLTYKPFERSKPQV